MDDGLKTRRPRRHKPEVDEAIKGIQTSYRWIEDALSFLVAVEQSVLAGEASLPQHLYVPLNNLLRR